MRGVFKRLLVFFAAPLALFSLSLVVSRGSYNDEKYSVIELERLEPFLCKEIYEETKTQADFLCTFSKIPLTRPVESQNDFFYIKPYTKDKIFHLLIQPKHKAVLIPQLESMLEAKSLYEEEPRGYRKWIVVGYEKNPPFLQRQKNEGINFAIKMDAGSLPSVGALNIEGEPISSLDNADFKEFNAFEKMFNDGDYSDLLRRINTKLERKEINKLFMPEILALKIKTLVILGREPREILESGIPWVESYTSHKDLPEIMLRVAQAYMKLGIVQEGMKLFNALIREYPGNSYAELAMIYSGEKLQKEGKVSSAKALYEKVLYSSDDVDVASLAAFNLANYYLLSDDVKAASGFFEKIITSNPKFFAADFKKYYNLAKELAQRKSYKTAGMLAKELLGFLDQNNKEYPALLLATARWEKDGGDFNISAEHYAMYLDKYPYMKNAAEVKRELDFLEFQMDAGNDSQKLALYDKIIDAYSGEQIANDALHRKMLLFYKNNLYEQMQATLKSFESLDGAVYSGLAEDVKRITRKLAKHYLSRSRCKEAIDYINGYDLLLPYTLDESIFACAKKVGDYDLALKISRGYIERTSPAQSVRWQENELRVLFDASKYEDFLLKASRLINMQKLLKLRPAEDILRGFFKANLALGKTPALRGALEDYKKYYPSSPGLLDLYKDAVEVYLKSGETDLAMHYAQLLLNAQRFLGVSTFSPFVEFALIQSGASKEVAVDLLQDLAPPKVEARHYNKILFTLGELYEQTGRADLAHQSFLKCAQTSYDDEFLPLCKARSDANSTAAAGANGASTSVGAGAGASADENSIAQ